MTIKLETFAGNASVSMDLSLPSGYWTVRLRDTSGELRDKMVYDTKATADACYDEFCRIAREWE